MPLYQWNDSPVAQLESITNAPGKVEAIIRPQAGADPKALSELRQALLNKGITNYIGCDKHTDTLIIPSIDNAGKLVSLLSQGGWTKGEAKVTETSEDKEIAADTSKEKLRKSSLFLSALFYDLGNVACLASGWQRAKHNRDGKWTSSDKSEFMTGVMFSIGDILLTVYGKDKTRDPLTAFSEDLHQHMAHFGIDIPKGDGVTPEQVHKSGFFGAVNDFLGHNITSIKCLSEAAGGAFMVKAAMKKGDFNGGKLTAGLLIATGWLSTFILDKPHAPPYEFKKKVDDIPQSTGAKLFDWVTQNPRARLGATFGMANNVSNLFGAHQERKKFQASIAEAQQGLQNGSLTIGKDPVFKEGTVLRGQDALRANLKYHEGRQHDYAWNVVSACSFLIAHSLFGISGSKKAERDVVDTKTFGEETLAVAANMLLNVPEEARELAVDQAADYISSIKGTTIRKEDAAKKIHDHIDHLRHSPFLQALSSNTVAIGR